MSSTWHGRMIQVVFTVSARRDSTAEQNHWSEGGRATPVGNAGALGRPHRSVLPFGGTSHTMKRSLTVAAAGMLWCAAEPEAIAQTPAGLDIQVYAGLTITGAVGTVYWVECVADLAQSNNPSAWRCLEFLQLPASPCLWADKSAPATERRFYRAVARDAPTNMVFIPPGTFRMGSPTNEVDRSAWEGPQTAVTITQGFWMGKYEVTQGEFLEVMGYNGSFFSGVHLGIDYGTDLRRPVEQVTWSSATNYCARLTQRERAAGRIPANCLYRLPTEAEWEYACRAWTSTRFSYGDDSAYTNLANYAWYCDNSDARTHPVGEKLPNPWGLHDMEGNVLEWCQNIWSDSLPGGMTTDPQGPLTGRFRVFRGGCWRRSGGLPGDCRSARRSATVAYDYYSDIGFRVVLSVLLASGAGAGS